MNGAVHMDVKVAVEGRVPMGALDPVQDRAVALVKVAVWAVVKVLALVVVEAMHTSPQTSITIWI